MYLSKGYKGIYDLYFERPITGKRTKVTTVKTTFSEAIKFRNAFNPETPSHSATPQFKSYKLSNLQKEVMEDAKNNMAEKTYDLYKKASII